MLVHRFPPILSYYVVASALPRLGLPLVNDTTALYCQSVCGPRGIAKLRIRGKYLLS